MNIIAMAGDQGTAAQGVTTDPRTQRSTGNVSTMLGTGAEIGMCRTILSMLFLSKLFPPIIKSRLVIILE